MKRLLLSALAAAMLAGPAAAHRGHATLSVVEIDAASGAVTVTHRMAAHDAEPALRAIAPNVQPNLDDPNAMAALTAYVGRHFTLADADGDRVALSPTGVDLDGDDVSLTFTGRLPAPATAVTVDSELFADIHADQENQVNVRRAKVTKTALFRPGEDAKRISFP